MVPCSVVGGYHSFGGAYRFRFYFCFEDVGDMFLRNVSNTYRTTQHDNPEEDNPLFSSPWKPQGYWKLSFQ
jgi:hypothetical protein